MNPMKLISIFALLCIYGVAMSPLIAAETASDLNPPASFAPSMLVTGSVAKESDIATISSVFGTQPLKKYALPFEDAYPTGPFENLGNKQFLFISKCGDVYFTKLDGDLKLVQPAKSLTKFIPGSESSNNESDTKQVVYCKNLSGVKDSLLVKNSLFVAYTTWDDQQNGARLAVSEFELDVANSDITFKREIYLSRPAIKEPFLGHQVGGKLVLGENDNTLFLSLGDFSKPERVQDGTTSLGKVIKIDLQRLNAEVYATGLRSPSGGMLFDRAVNELWVTDHGPRGGDEINLIKRGKNYGWPLVSYGTIYERDGMGSYYGNKFNNHEGYEKPAMTFVPSIGIGPIAKYADTGKNDYWDNDYFVAGMGSTTLYRVKKEKQGLVYAEPVLTGYRIRALKIDAQGNFYIKTDSNQFLISE